ncbi:alpha-hydroxy-acid oxidizing protein [Fusibacter ferrireducens]|uniref:L-lactate oxidase n=1 Tax=Fusibacter ferrireducens TaxID=2785058 RepID=A0ABR9ZSW8_9FIRM|nr:alpha-hydroxy-acid oxidizing protein [Fusibacter ferrireducens]MBF4692704.1 alpha-hydroxy-acid oxidizing protein [Fusibacter ferrireducens]
MNYQELVKNAKEVIGPHCKVCPECNGIACKGKIPGPGGKGTGLGFIRNYGDLKKISLNMDTIHNSIATSTKQVLFDVEFDLPVFAGPIGAVQMHYSDLYDDMTFSEALLKGCKTAGSIAFTGDGVKDEVYRGTVEAIKTLQGHGIPTIKPWREGEVIEKIRMAEQANAVAVAMDIDAAGLSILAAQGKPVSPMNVDTLKNIVSSTRLPFVIKGVMTVAGARKAVDAGAYAIIVSNHGGRVLDETPSSIAVLDDIVEAVKGQIKIIIDGGFRSGIDVFKALAIGADAVIIARPFVTAVYGGGEEGVALYVNKIKEELANAMIMTGCESLKDITKSKIRCTL